MLATLVNPDMQEDRDRSRGRSLRTRRILLAACLAVVLLLSGCSGSDASSEPLAETSTAAPERTRTPLEAAIGFSSEPGHRDQTFVTMQRRANESAIRCMQLAGFTYFVEPIKLFSGVGDGSRGWVEVNGLGITIALLELSALDSSERMNAAAANAAYTSTLSPEQTVAYDLALIGSGPPSEAISTAGFSPDGCWGRAYFDVFERLEAMAALNPKLEVLNARINEDPRVAALMETWSACMQQQGHRYADRGAMIDDLFVRLLSVDYVETDMGLELSDPAAVEELLGIEIDVALDDFDCGLSIADRLGVIRSDYEQRFVDDNQSLISSLGAGS